jgi:DNA adenine methylase
MTYPASKSASGVYQAIINQLPPHQVYIEPFLGSGSIMRLKKPAPGSIGIDIDKDLIRTWKATYCIYQDIPGLTLIWDDALSWLSSHPIPDDALIYLDPPYLMSTRRSRTKIYTNELTDQQHDQLLQIIRSLSCSVAISGYASSMYCEALRDWRLITLPSRTRGDTSALEHLWMNYAEPIELHDYRYLGGNCRERERIKRKQARWKQRLQTMPALERHAMLSVIQDEKNYCSSPSLIPRH